MTDAERQASADRSNAAIERKMAAWIKAQMIVVGLIALGFLLGGWQIDKAFDRLSDTDSTILEEREERRTAQSAINAYVCRTNNQQDGILGGLLFFTLSAAPPDTDLSAHELEGKEIFAKALAELEDKPDCAKLRTGLGAALKGGGGNKKRPPPPGAVGQGVDSNP